MTSPNPIASTIILIFALQAIVISILLLLKQPKRQSNFFLALLLFFFALMSINISMANILFSNDLMQVFRYVQLELLFGFGPALYFFTKSFTDPDYRFSKKEFVHFIPVILEFIFYRTPIYRLGSNGLYETPNHPFTPIYLAEQQLGVISIIVYVILSIHLLIKYRKWIRDNYSNLKNKSLSWLRVPIFIYSGYWILWIIITKIDFYVFQNKFRELYFFPTNILLSLVTTWIGFVGYIKSQIEVSGFSKTTFKQEQKSSDPEGAKLILEMMKNKKPYINPDLSLQKLSEITGLNSKSISRIINQDLQMNFYEFVNKYRVEEFKGRLEQPDSQNFTLLAHAFECGFNSKSTFNHIFKKYAKKTPREYYLELKNKSEGKNSDGLETDSA